MKIQRFYTVIRLSDGEIVSEHLTKKEANENCERNFGRILPSACEIYDNDHVGPTFYGETMAEAVKSLKADDKDACENTWKFAF